MKIFVIGHRQPDLDSISAALLYTELLKKLGVKNVIASYQDKLNSETTHILKKFKISSPKLIKKTTLRKDDQIILVDHNEESQRLPEVNPDRIIQIIDHHKAAFCFNLPIKIDIRPWGSTSTIIFDYFEKNKLKLSLKQSQLMLSAILSDTVGFNSPTTTNLDRQTAKKLATRTKTDLKELTLEIFKAKSKINHLTPKQIVLKDYKIFDFNGKKTLINQIETVEENEILKQKSQLIKAMTRIKAQEKLDYIFCIVSNILKIASQLIYTNKEEEEIAQRAFGEKGSEGLIDIGTRISRKKEIAPLLEKVIR
ncbi:manganese-dependent inorganic pyrophosphatase [Patescibacteria group bacterium]